MSDRDDLVQRHVELFNQGVRSGDWAPMLAHFTDDAELIFQGIPVGPFSGKQAIAEAYHMQPPDDEIDLLHVERRADEIRVIYAWRGTPNQPAGTLILTPAATKIARLLVLYGTTSTLDVSRSAQSTVDERLAQAVHNNAVWCDTIARLHGCPGEFRADMWLNRHPLPRFYPNAITLTGASGAAAQHSAIQELIAADVPGAWGVKDSLCTLDLSASGFGLLFEASWLWRAATLPQSVAAIDGVEWSIVRDEAALAAWELAWDNTPDEATQQRQPRVFLPTLLTDDSIAVLAARQHGRLVAGAIANRTAGVVGISNVFAPEHDAERFWAGCVAAALRAFPGLPLVGYERNRALEIALALGFEALGPLRVWLRQNQAA